MSFYEQFIPGQWIDNIDTNDFVNLNKKPFFKDPVFLKKNSDNIRNLFQQMTSMVQNEKQSISLKFSSAEWITMRPFHGADEQLPCIFSELTEKQIGSSESTADMKSFYHFEKQTTSTNEAKTTYALFDEVATSEIKKAIKIGLFKNTPATFNASFLFPDIRAIALYGTKRLIKEKLWSIKKSEKHLQTHDWIRNRMDIFEQIEQIKNFEKFSKKFQLDVKNPATSAREAISFSLLAIYYCFIENPSVYFSLGHLFSFFDIYLENDIANGVITEETAQDLIDEFYLKASCLRFVYSPALNAQHPNDPYFFGETFGGNYVTKTTYRALHSIKECSIFPFSVRILWHVQLPQPFLSFCNELLKKGYPLSFVKQNTSIAGQYEAVYPNGLLGIPGEDRMLDAGVLDLEKVFYLALNGGKDVPSNANFMPVTQPLRGDKMEYEEMVTKLKDYLSYALSMYVEKVNIVFYLYETQRNEFFQKALMNNLPSFKAQFNFSNLLKVIGLLHGIQKENYTIHRDGQWIDRIEVGERDVEQAEMIVLDLISFIEKEIKKIPLYKKGNIVVRFYQREMHSTCRFKETNTHYAFPFELVPAKFPLHIYEPSMEDYVPIIEDLFSRDFSEINVFTNENHYCLNGIFYHKNHNLSKKTGD